MAQADSENSTNPAPDPKLDAASAFHLASEMEDDILEIENLTAALRMMASSDE